MAYVNDAQTLADVVSPAAAAAQMGVQNDDANQAAQIANTTSQGQQAAEIQKPGLQNLFTAAQTSHVNADTTAQNLTNQGTAATQPGAIAATNAGNQTKITSDHVQALQQVGTIAGQVAGLMDNVPPAARPAAMGQIVQQYGIDPNSLGPLMSGDPDQLRQFSQQSIQAGSAYQEQLLKGNQEYSKQLDSTNALVSGRQSVAETQAQARTDAARISAQQRQQQYTAIKGQLVAKVAAGTASPQEKATLNWIAQTEQLSKSGNAMASSMMGLDTQPNTPAVPDSSPAPSGGGGNPPTNNPGPAIQKAVEASGATYDPQNFDYRVGPNGSIQRKAK